MDRSHRLEGDPVVGHPEEALPGDRLQRLDDSVTGRLAGPDHRSETQGHVDRLEDVLDRFNIAAGQKSEHYEIAMYENLVTLAESEGPDEAAELLRQNLKEERDEFETLEQKAVQFDQGELTA